MTGTIVFLIYASTGCTCCASDNHYRGPYKTKEDAQRRINFYYTGDYYPLASQYARRGRYSIIKDTVYEIDGSVISKKFGEISKAPLKFVEVNQDGSANLDDQYNEEYYAYI